MRVLWLGTLAVFGLSALLLTGDMPYSVAQVPEQKNLQVHEWGVLSVYNDTELAQADMRAVWAGLPRFVYGQVNGRKQPERLLLVKAPVLYFHAAQPLQVNVSVAFPKGKPAVWWPGNSNSTRGFDDAPALTSLSWQVNLKASNAPQVKERDLPKGHWMEALRAVKADDVVVYEHGPDGGAQKERFVYYDGLIPAPAGLTIRANKDQVALTSQAKVPLLDVTVVDLRDIRKIRVARLAKMEAGAEVKEIEFKDADQTKWPFDAITELVEQLKGAGLNEDEAKALAAVWRKDFFETEGLSVFYRLPQEIYDQVLPLTITPKPEKTVRVLLLHHPHCEPDLAERVAKLVQQLQANQFDQRVEAHKRLAALGRIAFVQLVKARKEATDPEVRSRLNKLLEDFETERSFNNK